jgi:hypothetical protein
MTLVVELKLSVDYVIWFLSNRGRIGIKTIEKGRGIFSCPNDEYDCNVIFSDGECVGCGAKYVVVEERTVI